MARKDQLSSKKDSCDICGTELDDDAVIQEFADGSVVKLCSECATAAPPEEELDDDFDLEPGDPTEEWAGPDEHHSPADSPRFEPEDFTVDRELESPLAPESPIAAGVSDFAYEEGGTTNAAAELAAWASAPSEEPELDSEEAELAASFDEEEAHEAALQLMAALEEADMAEEGGGLGVEVSAETEAAYESGYESGSYSEEEAEEETPEYEVVPPPVPPDLPATTNADAADAAPVDKTMDLLVPVTDLLSLQTEMQSALARLSSTLEHFVSDMVASEEKTSAINNRLQQLEDELESTRERLRETEALLPDSAYHAVAAIAAATAASDHDLIGTPHDTDLTDVDEGTPPPPLPAPGADLGKTGKRKAAAAAAPPLVPPPIVPPPIGRPAAPPSFGVTPPPLPPLPGMAKSAASALVPPPIGLAVPPPIVVPVALPTVGAAPPPLPPMNAPRPAVQPAAKPSVWPTVKPPADLDDDLGLDDDYGLPVEPAAAPSPTPAPAPAAKQAVKPAVPADRPKLPATADGTAVDADLLAPLPESNSHAHSVAGAAAAMSKLLRGRKGHQQPEPEPEPEPEPDFEEQAGLTFSIIEVQAAQRLFNESAYTKKIAEISKSIGKPKANVSRTLPGAPEAAITVFWDIVWYQFLLDLRKEVPTGTERVVLDREGMDLDELEHRFTEKNSTINDDGRLDASELEIRLLSDPDALITEMEIPVPSPEDRLADDATEEVWDQQSAPEFRWD